MIRSCLALLATAGVTAAQVEPPQGAGVPSDLPGLCAAYADDQGPGFAVLVTRNAEPLFRAAYGYADAAAREPLAPEHLFYVASVAKSVTAACVALLADRGQLDLDAPVRGLVPELGAVGGAVTPRQLLHHRSGLRDCYELEWLAARDPFALTPDAVLALLQRQQGLSAPPGQRCIYSNSGYVVLAELIRRRSGAALRAFAREHVFAELGMWWSHFHDGDQPPLEDVATGHLGDGSTAPPPPRLPGPGGLYTTVDDLDRWLLALRTDQWNARVAERLTTPPALAADQRRNPELEPYAGGLMVREIDGHRVLILRGGVPGWQATAIAVPDEELHVVVLANRSDLDSFALTGQLARAALAEPRITPAPTDRATPGMRIYRDRAGDLLLHTTGRDGSHLTTLGWRVEVASTDAGIVSLRQAAPLRGVIADDGALELTIGDGEPHRYERVTPVAPDPAAAAALAGSWRCAELDATLTLHADGALLRLDDRRMARPVAPFRQLDRDTWISDSRVELTVERDGDGDPAALRLSSGRARGLVLVPAR